LDPAATFTAIEVLLTNLTASVGYNDEALAAAAAALEDSLTRFRDSTKVLVQDQKTRKLEALDSKLFTSFAGRVAQLQDGLSPEEITLEDLPVHVSQRWLSANGTYRIEAYPDADLTRKGEMKRFVSAVRAIAGDSATGTPVINLGASDAVKLAFVQAFSYAFIVISALLLFILRSFKETLIVLAPLMLAGLLTAAASVIFELPFNLANIIALPLLLGIGVDSALHILHRYKTALPANGNLLQTSTARAVFFSALTTIVSFGNLATSAHAGTASMGIMLTIGVASTLSCTLLVLPAMLKQFIAINRS
jgi:predicted RND superfamily exporter protein